MLRRLEILQRAERDGVDAVVAERDYVLAHVVAHLYRARISEKAQLVFKGGTALRFVHLDEFRYSADLDFTVLNGASANGLVALQEVVEAARVHGGFPVLDLQITERPALLYRGPLQSDRLRRIKIDIADDEIIAYQELGVLRNGYWRDLPAQIPFAVYGAEEIAVEKVRCILQRVQCRDLYDLFRLIEDLNVDLAQIRPHFESKARLKGLDLGSFEERFENRLEHYRKRWNLEMQVYLLDPPEFESVSRKVRRALRRSGYFGR
jgi:predicted nucleotidyltransferase component of viral defense system